MSDDTRRREDEDVGPGSPGDLSQPEPVQPLGAEEAEADEARAAQAEAAYEVEEEAFDEEAEMAAREAAMAGARQEGLAARARWSLVHKELLLLLLANCMFFAGALAAWSRAVPGTEGDPASYVHGLDTIRGTVIFALAVYGFWIIALDLWYRQLIIWPYLINALLALWVGIPGFTRGIGGDAWDAAVRHVESLPSRSFLDKALIPLSSIPPAYWLLTAGGAFVLIILLKGVIGGAAAAKTTPAASSRSRYRR